MIQSSITQLSYDDIYRLLYENTSFEFYNKYCNTDNFGLRYLEHNLSPQPNVYYEIKQTDRFTYNSPLFRVIIAETETTPVEKQIGHWGMYYYGSDSLRVSRVNVMSALRRKGISAILLAILMIKLGNNIRKDMIFGICEDSSNGYWESLGLIPGRYDKESTRDKCGSRLGNSLQEYDRSITFAELYNVVTGLQGGIDTTNLSYRPRFHSRPNGGKSNTKKLRKSRKSKESKKSKKSRKSMKH